MTSYTRKLYDRTHGKGRYSPLRYGKQTLLATFAPSHDELHAQLPDGVVPAHIEPEFEVADNLTRWADRGFPKPE